MTVDVGDDQIVLRKHSHELLLLEMYLEHLDPIGLLSVERGTSEVTHRCAMENHEFA